MDFSRHWWKEGIIYQVYPQSFKDSDGDGIGDLKGLIEKLDYIKELGVDIIWINPIYVSPLDDNGYDIANYYEINPMYGTMQDFDELLEQMHRRGLKLLMDLVVNHCSDEHEWFVEARKGRDNPYRDYFYWKPGKNGGPPNNWESFFTGSVWEYNEATDDYYLHLFTKRQPDLNWENPKVREGMYDAMKFWLEKGIDGFRMDVISLISKRLDFSDSPNTEFGYLVEHKYANGPRIHEFLQEMHAKVLQHYDVMTVGEGPGITHELAPQYVGSDRKELNMIFQLEHMFIDFGPLGKFDPIEFSLIDLKKYYTKWNAVFEKEGWITSFLDNHDFARMVSRFGNDTKYRIPSAKVLCLLNLTMPGTPSIYFGSEIGMTNNDFKSIDECRDVETLNYWKKVKEQGVSEDDFLKIVNQKGRDNVRTPMQWNGQDQAGFTEGEPWLDVNGNYREINVDSDLGSSKSIFRFYQEMIEIRKRHDVLTYGSYEDLYPDHPDIFSFLRRLEDESFVTILNFSSERQPYKIPDHLTIDQVILSNLKKHHLSFPIVLEPWEGILLKVLL